MRSDYSKYLLYTLLSVSSLAFGEARTFKLTCCDPWFTFIENGTKPVEGRRSCKSHEVIDREGHVIAPGDEVIFFSEAGYTGRSCRAQVTEVRKYPSLQAYLQDVTVECAVPKTKSLEDAIKIYRQWSTPEQIERDGFLGIFIQSHTHS